MRYEDWQHRAANQSALRVAHQVIFEGREVISHPKSLSVIKFRDLPGR
jgi:hypothetical protein